MKRRVLLLLVLLICLATDARVDAGYPRKPNCHGDAEHMMCAMVYQPVCGNNGRTYSSECSMCSQLRGRDILIIKEGECS